MYKIPEHDTLLIKAFITREAADYNGRRDQKWIEAACKQVIDRIELSKTAITCKINSVGNSGAVIRSLTLDIENKEAWEKYDTSTSLEITLCSCGQLDHLFHVNVKLTNQ